MQLDYRPPYTCEWATRWMHPRQCEAIHMQTINITNVHKALPSLPHTDKGPAPTWNLSLHQCNLITGWLIHVSEGRAGSTQVNVKQSTRRQLIYRMYIRPYPAFHTQKRARPPHEIFVFIDATWVLAGLYTQVRDVLDAPKKMLWFTRRTSPSRLSQSSYPIMYIILLKWISGSLMQINYPHISM